MPVPRKKSCGKKNIVLSLYQEKFSSASVAIIEAKGRLTRVFVVLHTPSSRNSPKYFCYYQQMKVTSLCTADWQLSGNIDKDCVFGCRSRWGPARAALTPAPPGPGKPARPGQARSARLLARVHTAAGSTTAAAAPAA